MQNSSILGGRKVTGLRERLSLTNMPVEPEDLRATMRKWGATVAIVGSAHDGVLSGMTVTAFAPVTLEPPQILVSIEHGTPTHDAISAAKVFAVSMLAEEQGGVSARFADPSTEEADRFDGIATHTAVSGAPILDEALAFLDCKVVHAYDAGTHTVFVGLVEDCGVQKGSSHPLLYYDRGYWRISKPDGA